jgi:hypothetical protein
MIQWKFWKHLKPTPDTSNQINAVSVETKNQPEKETNPTEKVSEEPEEEPVLQYNEVLCAQSTSIKKTSELPERKRELTHRTGWETPGTIERNVDTIESDRTRNAASNQKTNDEIERKVDRLIAKKKLPP